MIGFDLTILLLESANFKTPAVKLIVPVADGPSELLYFCRKSWHLEKSAIMPYGGKMG